NTGRVLPGPFAGMMGPARDPWLIEASPFDPKAYGAFPAYEFDHQERPHDATRTAFTIPNLSLPEELRTDRLDGRLDLLKHLDAQRRGLDEVPNAASLDRNREAAVSLLLSPSVRKAFDVTSGDP